MPVSENIALLNEVTAKRWKHIWLSHFHGGRDLDRRPKLISISASQRKKWRCHPEARDALEFHQVVYGEVVAPRYGPSEAELLCTCFPIWVIRKAKNRKLEHFEFFSSFSHVFKAELSEKPVLGLMPKDEVSVDVELIAWMSVIEPLRYSLDTKHGAWNVYSAMAELMPASISNTLFGVHLPTRNLVSKIIGVPVKKIDNQRDRYRLKTAKESRTNRGRELSKKCQKTLL